MSDAIRGAQGTGPNPQAQPSPCDPVAGRSLLAGLLRGRFGLARLFLLLFVGVAIGTRLELLWVSRSHLDFNGSLLGALLAGIPFDIGAGLLAALPLVLWLLVLPRRVFQSRWGRTAAWGTAFVCLFILLFQVLAENTFWEEFEARFNFIAVDYLVYTTEVLDNIRESYPLVPLLLAIAGLTLAATYGLARTGWMALAMQRADVSYARRLLGALGWLAASGVALLALDGERVPHFVNNYHRELCKNGTWSLFAAFWDNELDFDRFYPTVPIGDSFARLWQDFEHEGTVPLTPPLEADGLDSLRWVQNPGPEQHLNVIQVTIESLSANFLGHFGNPDGLTPNLDALAEKSLSFENFYATGTRTDRGMEALSLSIPPTPGRSLIKRPKNAGLFSLGQVLDDHGYKCLFLYGGYGYFDNMNAFFGGNGYGIVDRADVPKEAVTFANAWGACDEDLYRWTIEEADKADAERRPFHFFVMTTSNHRPYTYPEGKIDLPPKVSRRRGAVKYTDYAIGQLLEQSASKPWFNHTVFVFVADHCASSAGKTELPVERYRIPMFIYAPGGQLPTGSVETLCSQIDFAPTLLAMLGISYQSRFFGTDVFGPTPPERALLGTYQKLGFLTDDRLTVLSPVKRAQAYGVQGGQAEDQPGVPTPDELACTIAYYAAASFLYHADRYRSLPGQQPCTRELAPMGGRSGPPERL